MLKSDFHAHTNLIQKHSELSPKQLIDLAVKHKYDVITITEHAFLNFWFKLKYYPNAVKTYDHIKNYAKKKGILLIPGIETFVEGREILLINFNKKPKKFTFDDLYELKNENVLIVAPHPFYGKKKCIGDKIIEHIKLFDAIEYCHLYCNFINPNKKAVEIAKKYKKTLLANSDAHFPYHLNLQSSLLDCNKNKDSILEAIRKNKVKIETKPMPTSLFIKEINWLITTNIKRNTKELIKDVFKS